MQAAHAPTPPTSPNHLLFLAPVRTHGPGGHWSSKEWGFKECKAPHQRAWDKTADDPASSVCRAHGLIGQGGYMQGNGGKRKKYPKRASLLSVLHGATGGAAGSAHQMRVAFGMCARTKSAGTDQEKATAGLPRCKTSHAARLVSSLVWLVCSYVCHTRDLLLLDK
jgi:hypothetical protein